LPQRLSVAVEHSSAVGRVIDGDGTEVASAEGALEATLPAGAYTVEVSAPGCNTRVTELFLDGSVDMRVWPDPEGQLVECIGHIACAGAPKGVHVTPDGREAWATILNGPPSIEIFNLASMQRSGTVELGAHGAVEIIFTRDGSRAYASQMETAKVFEIDTATRAILRELPTESAWTKVVALSPDESTLYAANWSGNDVSEIDLDTGSVRRRIPTASTPRGLWPTPDGASLYVAGFGGGELQRVDLASGSVTTVFDSDGALRHLVGDADRGVLYASDMARDCVWIHDLASGETSRFIDTDAKPNTIALSPDGAVLFVSCRGANNPKSYYIPGPEWGTILLYDAETGAPLDAIVGGNQCTALDISADGATLVFSDFLDDRLRAYRVPAYETLIAGNGGRWEQHYADLRK
ncbi:MAG: YncE family protein, partial [Coriobacteriia bacterium]|nr:YncE family protein [Coriobacteriia bacterium]